MDDRHGHLELPKTTLWHALRGEGPPVTFLHAGICDARSWEPQVAVLSERFTTLRYDRRGFGLSESESDDYHPHEDLLALLDHLDIGRTHLVGCSQGGKIAVDFALTHPERVGSLVLTCSALSGHEYEGEWPAVAHELERVCEEDEDDLETINDLEIDLWVVGSDRTRDDLPAPLLALCLDMNRIALEGPEPDTLSPEPAAATRLDQVAQRTLVITGERDVPRTLASCQVLVDGIPGARHAQMSGCAHLPNLERPEEFNELVLDFLSED
ncbi:MAG: alpha/beta fold hydrolase [Acidobacteriota bacterium]